MSKTFPPDKTAGLGAANSIPKPYDDPRNIVVGMKEGVTLLNHPYLDVIMRMPLPGIVIFVHGVNSDGEWYAQAEQGLCAGLNERLKRCDEHMVHCTPEGGQLAPATYMAELTPDGFINPDMKFNTFMQNDAHFSPVIHFRWGYKANGDELQKYGDGIYLNEENYWGGGPFANGCTSLPDLWGNGLSDTLFLWMHIQHLNPSERNVYSCPPRSYYVLAALRLARLVESIRKKQADVPITIVCHSQGNMIGMAAAFLGDAMSDAVDATGLTGRCVADNYVLCNAPYSLVKTNALDDWSARGMTDKQGASGRQTGEARIQTLRAFFDIIRKPASKPQAVEDIDQYLANAAHGFNIADDRRDYGFGIKLSTCCRVTLYCNPHDQVISSSTVQGIGWRGLSQKEIDVTKGAGVFCQRVFAQQFDVGVSGKYHYWNNHYKKPKAGSPGYWFPQSQKAEYALDKGVDANTSILGKVLSIVFAPIGIVAVKLAGTRINAVPDEGWEIPLNARNLPQPFKPQAVRFGSASEQFDEGYDAPGQERDSKRQRQADDPYAGDRQIAPGGSEGKREDSDAAQGGVHSEAALRYDDHARLRMQARREGRYKNEERVAEEDKPETASADYQAWRSGKIKKNLATAIDAHATDHSTIMTNAMHARMALAYDVAIGHCHISDKDLQMLRRAADWRFLDGLGDTHKAFKEYFDSGWYKGVSLDVWTHTPDSDGAMPKKIVDQRQNPPLQQEGNG